MLGRRIPVDVVCPDLVPERRMHVAHLELDSAEINIRYTLTPPLPAVDPYVGDRPMVGWWWEATDDRGTRYRDMGGAHGPSPDGWRTQGVFSLTPSPPPEAQTLRVVLHAVVWAEAHERECAFTVDLTGAAG